MERVIIDRYVHLRLVEWPYGTGWIQKRKFTLSGLSSEASGRNR